jgi:hypothetical protein
MIGMWLCSLTHGSWPLKHWDRGFKFRSKHGYLSALLCVVVPCVRKDHATADQVFSDSYQMSNRSSQQLKFYSRPMLLWVVDALKKKKICISWTRLLNVGLFFKKCNFILWVSCKVGFVDHHETVLIEYHFHYCHQKGSSCKQMIYNIKYKTSLQCINFYFKNLYYMMNIQWNKRFLTFWLLRTPTESLLEAADP